MVTVNELTYQYLGIEQVFKSNQTTVRECLIKTYAKRLNRIWSSALSSKHKAHATNTWAVAVFRYFFAQIKLLDKVLVQLDRLTGRTLRRYRSHHYSASIERLYLKRVNGGRGLCNIRDAYEKEVVASAQYLLNAARHDELLQTVAKHQLYLGEQARYSNLQKAFRVLGRHELWPDLEESARRGNLPPQ